MNGIGEGDIDLEWCERKYDEKARRGWTRDKLGVPDLVRPRGEFSFFTTVPGALPTWPVEPKINLLFFFTFFFFRYH